MAHLEAASSDRMFLEDTQIDLPYSCHAITRSWLVHGFADQGARLYVDDTLASPSTLFQIDHHADHTHPESGARVGNGRTFQCGEGWHSNENAVRFWTPSPRVPKEADTRCYAFTTAYATMIQLCNAFWAQSKTPPPSPH